MAFRQIRLPSPPPSTPWEVPEIFEQGLTGTVVHRALIIGNGTAGAEHQCIGLVRALGLGDKFQLHRIARPKGTYHAWLRWLPLDAHQSVNEFWHRHLSWLDWLPLLMGVRRAPKRIEAPRTPRPLNPGSASLPAPDADAEQIASLAKEELELEGPLLVVACGRDTVETAITVRELAPKATFVVQIQHPRCDLSKFDLVVAPAHDFAATEAEAAQQQLIPKFLQRLMPPRQLPDKNVVETVGALHHADGVMLRQAAADWHDELAALPRPVIVVCVGGPTRHCQYGDELGRELASSLKKVLVSSGGSVRITTSRRTPPGILRSLRRELGNHPGIYIWDGRGSNPHMGNLAWADAFVVTADSISMLSEACSTGKPVYVIGSKLCTGKFGSFHKALRLRKCTRPFLGTENMRESWSYPPLDDTSRAATRVREAMAMRGWIIK